MGLSTAEKLRKGVRMATRTKAPAISAVEPEPKAAAAKAVATKSATTKSATAKSATAKAAAEPVEAPVEAAPAKLAKAARPTRAEKKAAKVAAASPVDTDEDALEGDELAEPAGIVEIEEIDDEEIEAVVAAVVVEGEPDAEVVKEDA